jgi:two-component system, OmpR family, KDP operon response regulator KdpE
MEVIKETSLQKILVVSGDAASLRLLRIALLAQGYLVHVATCGLGGITAAADWRPDLILMELVFPDICGIELCHQLRLISQVPIIALSQTDDDQKMVDILDAGADDYILKPFSLNELKARVRRKLLSLSSANGTLR